MVPPEPQGGGTYHVNKAALNMLALREHILYTGKGLKIFVMCPGFVVSNLRGTTEKLRSGWWKATSASISGKFLLNISNGKRGSDVGKFVWKDGVYEW